MSALRPQSTWLAFGAGALVALPVLALGPALTALAAAFDGALATPLYRAFGNAAIPEEVCKFIFVYSLVTRSFSPRGPVRAMTTGAAVGFGFGAVETLLYALNNGPAIGLLRFFTAIPCHVFLGAIMAHYVWAFRLTRAPAAAVKALLVPGIAHGLYNFPLMADLGVTAAQPAGAMMLTWMVLFLLAGWTRLLAAGYRRQLFLEPA